MPRYDFECSTCEVRHLDVAADSSEHVELCKLCLKEMRKIFLFAPAIKKKAATIVERGIKRDLIEMARLEDIAAQTKNRDTRREIEREVQRINTTEVTHPTGGK